jgi:hypothetical protein
VVEDSDYCRAVLVLVMNMVCPIKRRFPLLGERLEACQNARCTI